MLYSDEENKRWWMGLSNAERTEIFERMEDAAKDVEFKNFALNLARQWNLGGSLTPKQVAAVRKWAR